MVRKVVVKHGESVPSLASVFRERGEEDDDDDDETVIVHETEEQTIKRLLADSERESQFDIFANLGTPLMDRGLCLKYMIQRSGTVVGWRSHPYTWEMLKTEFGGGSYTVTAKHPHSNVFVKKQSMSLEGKPQQPTEEDTRAQHAPMQPQPSQGENFIAPLMGLISTVLTSRQSDGGSSEIIKAMQASNQTQFQMMQQMMTQINESNMRNTQFQMQILEKMNDRIEAVMRREGDKYSANDVLKATQDAQEAGFRLFAQLQTMASQVADEKMAMLPEASQPKSMMDTLIESLAPMVINGMSGGAKAAPTLPAQPVRAGGQINPNAVSFPKVALPQRQGVSSQVARVQPTQPQSQPQPQPHPQPQPQAKKTGLPTLVLETEVKPNPFEKWIETIGAPLQVAWATSNGEESMFRAIVLAELDKRGFPYGKFVGEVSRADINSFALANAPQLLPVFEALYGDFAVKAGVVGSSTAQPAQREPESEPSRAVSEQPA